MWVPRQFFIGGVVCLLSACQPRFYDLRSPGQATLQVPGSTSIEEGDEPFFHITTLEDDRAGRMVIRVKFINENRRFITDMAERDWSVHFDVEDCEVSWEVSEQHRDSPVEIVAVADYSGSMRDDVDRLNWGLYGLSTELRAQDELALLAFDHRRRVMRELSGGVLDRGILGSIIYALGGDTHMYRAVERGLRMFEHEPEREPLLILFSDGKDNEGDRGLQDAHWIASDARELGAPIFTIGIGAADPRELEQLAVHSGGQFHRVQSFYDLSAFFIDIMQSTKHYYELDVEYDCSEAGEGSKGRPTQVTVEETGGGIVYSDTRLLPLPAPPRPEPPSVGDCLSGDCEQEPAREPFELLVEFDHDKDTIKPESYPRLDGAVLHIERLQAERGRVRLQVEGHTDSDGSEEYNEDLSMRRAQAVKRYLVKQGVEPSLLIPTGRGERDPKNPNTTEEGKARNRRVLLRPIQ